MTEQDEEMMDEDIPLTSREIIHLIDNFLQKRTESKGSSFARVTHQNMHDLSEIIYKIIEAKWGRDADGDLPVKYDLTDWTRYQAMYWTDVPHRSRDLPGHIEATVRNLHYAIGQVEHIFEILRYYNKDLKPMLEYISANHPDCKVQNNADHFINNWFKDKDNE